jgi:hypothetical protein
MSSENKRRLEIAVFPSGPGDCMTVREKMPMISNRRYWKSYTVHR